MENPSAEPNAETTVQNLPVPTVGRIVLYRVTQNDIEGIMERRKASGGLFNGNPMDEGDAFPFLITEAWTGESPNKAVNGQLFLDGNDTYWLTSRMVGEGPGTWSWPKR